MYIVFLMSYHSDLALNFTTDRTDCHILSVFLIYQGVKHDNLWAGTAGFTSKLIANAAGMRLDTCFKAFRHPFNEAHLWYLINILMDCPWVCL